MEYIGIRRMMHQRSLHTEGSLADAMKLLTGIPLRISIAIIGMGLLGAGA